MSDGRLLENEELIRWCFVGITDKTLANTGRQGDLINYNKQEQDWARRIIGGIGAQWTTVLCQNLVKEALTALGQTNVRVCTQMQSSVRDKKYSPDLESDDFVYEVKGRNWTTTGTAGEKILGVPLKYGEVPNLYHKPLKIVLVGYQEFEARKAFAFGDLLDANDQTSQLRESLEFYKKHNIEYIGFTDMLKELGLGKEYWNE